MYSTGKCSFTGWSGKIGDTAFCDTGLLTVSLPDTVTEIGNGVFDGSTRKSLTYVKWTAGVPVIPAGCFAEKTGHQWGAYKTDNNATCTKDGTRTAKCNNCTAANTVSDSGSKTGHQWGEWKNNF